MPGPASTGDVPSGKVNREEVEMTQQLMLRERAGNSLTLEALLNGRNTLVPVAAASSGIGLAEVAPRVADLRDEEARREERRRQKEERAAQRRRLAEQRRSQRQVFSFD